jgi:hypothetical protein
MIQEYVCIVGLDEPEFAQIRERIDTPMIAHETLPRILVRDGQLWAESDRSSRMVAVSKVVYHAIFADDLDFMVGLALWGGACLPNPRAMMDARLKLPCLVKALDYTRFGSPRRGYASPNAVVVTDETQVAKWGNWHCGENKSRFTGMWMASEPSIIEPYFEGQAVRVALIGDHAWQICLQGDDWLKSIHHPSADFMEIDPDLLEDTQRIREGFGLEIVANDYIVARDGSKHLLEVNHIPNVTHFPQMWEAYRDYVVSWINL